MDLRKIVMGKLFWLAFIAVVLVVSGCGGNSGDGNSLLAPAYLLPDDNDISNWARIGTYDEATDYESLYDLIDGGAQVYTDNGFVSAVFQMYDSCTAGTCGLNTVRVRIYDMEDEANASALYDRIAAGMGISWSGAGAQARIDDSALGGYTIEFWQRNFFAQVIIDDKTDEALNVAKLFATQISREID